VNQPLGPALLSCIRQNGKYEFLGLKERSGGMRPTYAFEFQSIARTLSLPWHHIYYAEYLAEKEGRGDREILLWFLMHILYQSGAGHLRTDLSQIGKDLDSWCRLERDFFPGSDEEFSDLIGELAEIRGDLEGTWGEVIGRNPSLFGGVEGVTPFIYQAERQIVYLRNFFKMERKMLISLDRLSEPRGAVAFPENELLEKILNHRLVILSGGPGTGKTTMVTALLRSLILLDRGVKKGRIFLAAPTGRAANRMIESMEGQLKADPMDSVDDKMPRKAYTLHKLLRINRETRGVYYNRERSIPADLVVLDEASMVDARMMSLLFEALAPDTTLLLVGDRDQLPSVDAGAVFGDFVAGAEKLSHKLHKNTLFLTKSWRSSSGIIEASRAVLAGDRSAVERVFHQSDDSLNLEEFPDRNALVDRIIETYGIGKGEISRGASPEDIFGIYERTAVLTPVRRGPFGVESLNRSISRTLNSRDRHFYHGQPLMILSNDYNLSLFNGDRGVIMRDGAEYYALFRDGAGSFRRIPAGKLNSWETAYCQTVHKSQGSEFENVLFLIPEGSERLLTREIVYTGITRAKKGLTLFSSGEVLAGALSRHVVRHSGIREYLGGKNGI